jgi:cell wall assembly regulator SMI1
MFTERIAEWGEATFREPAGSGLIRTVEQELGHGLPGELRELLAETNGIEGEYGLGLLWRAERIAQDNAHFRTNEELRDLYMPFDGIVFFADAGNGDQFGVSLSGNHEVYVWNHEDDSRVWVAPTILGYLENWMTGRLTV